MHKIQCPRCKESAQVKKHGKDRRKTQRYFCNLCHGTFIFATDCKAQPKNPQCPKCKESAQVKKHGFYKRGSLREQRYLCPDCRLTFKQKYKTALSKRLIEAIDLLDKGQKKAEVAKQMKKGKYALCPWLKSHSRHIQKIYNADKRDKILKDFDSPPTHLPDLSRRDEILAG